MKIKLITVYLQLAFWQVSFRIFELLMDGIMAEMFDILKIMSCHKSRDVNQFLGDWSFERETLGLSSRL